MPVRSFSGKTNRFISGGPKTRQTRILVMRSLICVNRSVADLFGYFGSRTHRLRKRRLSKLLSQTREATPPCGPRTDLWHSAATTCRLIPSSLQFHSVVSTQNPLSRGGGFLFYIKVLTSVTFHPRTLPQSLETTLLIPPRQKRGMYAFNK